MGRWIAGRWIDRQQARYHYRQGLTQLRRGDLDQAVTTLHRALGHHPRPAELHNELGKAYWQAGAPEQALEQFTQAIALAPDNLRALGNRGLLYAQRGQESLALADWQKALAIQPDHPLIHYNRGLLYLGQGQYSAALADLDAAIAANPNLAEAYWHRGQAHEALGQSEAAAQDWELALCNDRNLDQARLKLAALHQAHRDRLLAEHLHLGLGLKAIAIAVQHRDEHLLIQIERPVGVGLNYFTLPDKIRTLLLDCPLAEVESFELLGQVQNQRVVEWRGQYKLFQGQPCPPARWHRVLLTAFVIFPPLGIPALACAMNLRQAYQRGDYRSAQRAAKTVQGLCRAGGIISLTLLTLAAAHWGHEHLHGLTEAMAAPTEQTEPKPMPPTGPGT